MNNSKCHQTSPYLHLNPRSSVEPCKDTSVFPAIPCICRVCSCHQSPVRMRWDVLSILKIFLFVILTLNKIHRRHIWQQDSVNDINRNVYILDCNIIQHCTVQEHVFASSPLTFKLTFDGCQKVGCIRVNNFKLISKTNFVV